MARAIKGDGHGVPRSANITTRSSRNTTEDVTRTIAMRVDESTETSGGVRRGGRAEIGTICRLSGVTELTVWPRRFPGTPGGISWLRLNRGLRIGPTIFFSAEKNLA